MKIKFESDKDRYLLKWCKCGHQRRFHLHGKKSFKSFFGFKIEKDTSCVELGCRCKVFEEVTHEPKGGNRHDDALEDVQGH